MIDYCRRIISNHPQITKSIFTGTLVGVSDILCQTVFSSAPFDITRTAKFFAMGLFWFGPMVELWYGRILPKITSRYFSNFSKTKRILSRLFVDTIIFAPISNIGFFLFHEMLENQQQGKLFKHGKEEIMRKILFAYMFDLLLWVPANLINFWYIPIQFQGMYVGLFNVIFSTGLSYIAHEDLTSKFSMM